MMADWAPCRVSFTNLLDALWKADQDEEGSTQTYAATGSIGPNQWRSVLDSVIVEGAGELRLPLSRDDCVKLLGVCEQAPFGRGLDTVVDTAVRRAWQVDASKVTLPDEFASKTVLQIANKAVRALGLDGAAVQLEAHLYKLLLYEPGGHFSLHRDTEKEPGMLATLVLQLPTEGGFEGGLLVVRHGRDMKIFNFSMQSSTDVFYTVFFADCEHELVKVTRGTRLCLAFNLVQPSDESFGSSMPNEVKGFSSRLAKVEAALRPLLASGGESTEDSVLQRLAIPLKHKYTKTNLSFARLKGKDRMVAQVLRNCQDNSGRPWLDLHLCMVTKYQCGLPEDDGYNGYSRSDFYEYENSSEEEEEEEDEEHAMEEVHEEYVEFTNWVGTNNKRCDFQAKIVKEREIAMGENEELFEEDENPDETEYEGYTGNAGPTLQYWYHKAVIVVWSKKLTRSIARKVGYDGALDILERKVAEKDPDAVKLLRDMLIYWESQSSRRISFDSSNSRLLELCLSVGGLQSFLHALRLLSKTGLCESTPDWFQRIYRGNETSGEATAAAIAKGVQVYGWNTCASLVLELLKKDVTSHCNAYCNLAFKLQALGCHDAASMVAKRTLEAAMAACSSWIQLSGTNLYSLTKLLVLFKESTTEFCFPFLKRFKGVSIGVLHSLVGTISSQISKEVLEEEGSAGATLFTKICEVIISRDSHREMVNTTSGSRHETMFAHRGFCSGRRYSGDYNGSTRSSFSVVNVVLTFCLLGREELLSKLIQALVDQSRQHNEQHLLNQLLGSDAIWRGLSTTSMGGLQLLVESRVNSLAAKGKPVFTWCMPSARLPSHPIVEAFLKSPQQRFTYKGSTLGGLPGARKFAQTFFNGSYQNGFSATGMEGGRGVEAFCVITKTRTAFQHEHNQWAKDQSDIKALRNRLMKTQAAASTQAGLGIRAENVIPSPDANTPPRLHKKRRVGEPETVDLTLDDD